MSLRLEKNFYLDENMLCRKTNITFRIIGSKIVPNEITKALGVEPTRAFAKGENYQSKRVGIRQRPIGHWSVSTEGLVDSTSVECHALKLLELFDIESDALKALQGNEDYRISVVVWWEALEGHGGYTLSSETLRRLTCLCTDIDFQFIAV
jgi:hypothetical protein